MWFSCASSEKKKLRWVNFPPLRKKTTIAPRKNDEKCPTLPRTTKKKFEKNLAKKAEKQSRKKIWKKLQNIHKKHMMNEKRLLNAVTIFWVKRMKKNKNF